MIKNKKGFTLIELIIVMAIIGILAVVAIVAISGKSADARDARRMADMSAVQTGLALFCITEAEAARVTTITCDPNVAIGGTVKLNTCDDPQVLPTIAFTGIKDPASVAGTAKCEPGAGGALCEYSVAIPGAIGSTDFDSCAYTIYARLETAGASDLMTVNEAGVTRS